MGGVGITPCRSPEASTILNHFSNENVNCCDHIESPRSWELQEPHLVTGLSTGSSTHRGSSARVLTIDKRVYIPRVSLDLTLMTIGGDSTRVTGLHPDEAVSVLLAKVQQAWKLPDHVHVQLCSGERVFGEDELNQCFQELGIQHDSVVSIVCVRQPRVFEYLGDQPPIVTEMGNHFLQQKRLYLGIDGTCRLLDISEKYEVKGFVARTLALYHGTYGIDQNFDLVMCDWVRYWTKTEFTRIFQTTPGGWEQCELAEDARSLRLQVPMQATGDAGKIGAWVEVTRTHVSEQQVKCPCLDVINAASDALSPPAVWPGNFPS